jgi:hypothetical protein
VLLHTVHAITIDSLPFTKLSAALAYRRSVQPQPENSATCGTA